MATTKVFNYDLVPDQDVKIKNAQLNAVARDYLRGFFKELQYAGLIEEPKTLDNGGIQSELKTIDGI